MGGGSDAPLEGLATVRNHPQFPELLARGHFSENRVREALRLADGDAALAQDVLSAWERVPPPSISPQKSPRAAWSPSPRGREMGEMPGPSWMPPGVHDLVKGLEQVGHRGDGHAAHSVAAAPSFWPDMRRLSQKFEELARNADEAMTKLASLESGKMAAAEKKGPEVDGFAEFFGYDEGGAMLSPRKSPCSPQERGLSSPLCTMRFHIPDADMDEEYPHDNLYCKNHDDEQGARLYAAAAEGAKQIAESGRNVWNVLRQFSQQISELAEEPGGMPAYGSSTPSGALRSSSVPINTSSNTVDTQRRMADINALLARGWERPEEVRRMRRELARLQQKLDDATSNVPSRAITPGAEHSGSPDSCANVVRTPRGSPFCSPMNSSRGSPLNSAHGSPRGSPRASPRGSSPRFSGTSFPGGPLRSPRSSRGSRAVSKSPPRSSRGSTRQSRGDASGGPQGDSVHRDASSPATPPRTPRATRSRSPASALRARFVATPGSAAIAGVRDLELDDDALVGAFGALSASAVVPAKGPVVPKLNLAGLGKGKGPPPPKGWIQTGPPAGADAAPAAGSAPPAEANKPAAAEAAEPKPAPSPEGAAKAKGKGKGKGPPPKGPPTKAAAEPAAAAAEAPKGGKGPPPKKAPPPKGKAAAAEVGKGKAKAKSSMQPLFGRRLDWQGLSQEKVSGTVFADASEEVPTVDLNRLKALFEKPKNCPAVPSKEPKAAKPALIQLFSAQRAQNILIALKRQPLTEQILEALQSLDFSAPSLSAEVCEVLLGALPTPEEAKLLVQHRDRTAELREVERSLLPLACLEKPPAGQRLRIVLFGKTMPELASDLRKAFADVKGAFNDARGSAAFRKVLLTTARLGNVINYGAVKAEDRVAAGFSLEALPKLCLFKATSDQRVSLLHVLVSQVLQSDPALVEAMRSDLSRLKAAKKWQLGPLAEDVAAFRREASNVAAVSDTMRVRAPSAAPDADRATAPAGDDEEGVRRMSELAGRAVEEAAALEEELKTVREAARQTLSFFVVNAKPAEQDKKALELLGLLDNFQDSFFSCVQELQSNQQLAQLFQSPKKKAPSPDTDPESKQRRAPAGPPSPQDKPAAAGPQAAPAASAMLTPTGFPPRGAKAVSPMMSPENSHEMLPSPATMSPVTARARSPATARAEPARARVEPLDLQGGCPEPPAGTPRTLQWLAPEVASPAEPASDLESSPRPKDSQPWINTLDWLGDPSAAGPTSPIVEMPSAPQTPPLGPKADIEPPLSASPSFRDMD